ncbi:hypothetical protein [Polluticoccus soli]|uniref:hypothetical protein n=1 Tax=Polluticoccus soli TaxID=3034150 RepID=UPI0023E207DD|nr:hypothetical protein [Flavipsychrobacter sp. JY13-12]
MQEIKQSSLRDALLASIGDFLWEEGFKKDDITKRGILEVINLISDYHEEGTALYPEVLVTNNLDFFETIPNKDVVIQEGALTIEEFRSAVKLCAPLAINSWIIFIEVKGNRIKYGITSAEMTETSPSIYHQTVGELRVEYKDTTIAYIRNIGQKTVELAGLKNRLVVSLTLDEPKPLTMNEISELCQSIAAGCEQKLRVNVKTFFEKLIDETLKIGHGNLIGIVEDDDKKIDNLKAEIKGNGGIYLAKPIDFQSLIEDSEINKNSESSINLKAFASVIKSMLNHDGITIISTKARLIGYHILIDSYVNKGDVLVGGARSKAFVSMQNCGHFKFCFYKSQDGNIKIWKKP